MNFRECKESEDWVDQVNRWCDTKIRDYGARSLFLPAGDTPVPIYQDWQNSRPAWLTRLSLIQIDDVISGAAAGTFQRFFQKQLPDYPVLPLGDAPRESDLAILGLGPNGHIAFHEPGIPESFEFGRVTLTAETCNRLKLPAGTEGVTYGVGSVMKCKAVLLIARGKNKEEIVKALRSKECRSETLPACALKAHPDFTLIQIKG